MYLSHYSVYRATAEKEELQALHDIVIHNTYRCQTVFKGQIYVDVFTTFL